MFTNVWWIWAWASTNSSQSFKWTITVSGLQYTDVLAEATLSKVALVAGAPVQHAKATVWAASNNNPSGSSVNWGMDNSPFQFIEQATTVTFAIEVAGAFAAMTGKVYLF